jgi:hypothetical protein
MFPRDFKPDKADPFSYHEPLHLNVKLSVICWQELIWECIFSK